MTKLSEIKERCEKATPPDCGDHSCMYAANKIGVRTNGGCRCAHFSKSAPRMYFQKLHAIKNTDIPYLLSVIDKLAEGLMFYADERTWHRKEIGLDPNGCIARDDLGEKAKEALKVLEE